MTNKQAAFLDRVFDMTPPAARVDSFGEGCYFRPLAVSLVEAEFPDADGEKVVDAWINRARRAA